MNTNNHILAHVKLNDKVLEMPDGGLTNRLLRVEVADEQLPDNNWISEIKVLGDLPWYEGEERQVELRIMSEEFRKHVQLNNPNLLVKYGSIDVGYLKVITE